jgi:predicted DNA-binding transcriptional regulator YafY
LSKTDRTARLLNVEHLLYQKPRGLTVEEIANFCGVTKRTTYRDLKALEDALKIPIWQEGIRRGIVEGHFLPPIRFTVPEALNVFLAARLMLSYARRYDPSMASIFTKLNSIVPSPLREDIQKTLEWMQRQPRNDKYLQVLTTLAEVWVSRHRVRIVYRALGAKKAAERIIEPYFIEPAATGHASYVIAYCHRTKSLRIFKIERIESAEITAETYVIPPDFNASAYLSSSWGIEVGGEVKTIRLKFVPELARIMEETIWHPSQVVQKHHDGSVILTLRVTETSELLSWILGWGDRVEVLEPKELRREVIASARAMLNTYKRK